MVQSNVAFIVSEHGEAGAEAEVSRSTLVSRNITVCGRRTSVRLEPEMWSALREISRREKCRIHDVCSLIDMRKNQRTSLTAAIRVFLMLYYRAASTEEGHIRCGHGNFKNMMDRAKVSRDHMEERRSGINGIVPVPTSRGQETQRMQA